ncbi:helix-turn-helix transcriptional regulator [uncultured Sphingobium sp.]|uniref:helix-turn-helix transcriptional regulator n=1 Tax=uncultured Sphingobium sp. TaxID=316087 RepID=UPI00259AFF93|nr:helix-turn-helix transcriptional regulator [uncultured Sphingobium sp.]
METASDIIDALGGTSAVARELDLPPSTVSSWKSGDRIPKWRKPGVQAMADRLNIDISPVPSSGKTPSESPSIGEAA